MIAQSGVRGGGGGGGGVCLGGSFGGEEGSNPHLLGFWTGCPMWGVVMHG